MARRGIGRHALGCGVTAARRQASRLAGLVRFPVCWRVQTAIRRRPHGSHKGQCPLTPDCAPQARRALVGHESWLRSYRRDTTGATARGSGVISCQLADTDRHSATGLMARYKGQRGFETTLAFCVAKISKPYRNIPTGNACVCPMPSAGARAAIGSGGKKARPF